MVSRRWPAAVVVAAMLLAPCRVPAAPMDYSAPEEVYQLRARDPQQPIAPPERMFWPAWQATHRPSFYGWVDCGLGANTLGSAFNGPVGPQDRNWQAMMNQLCLIGERKLDTNDGGWDWGARAAAHGTEALPFGRLTTLPNGLVTGDAYGQWYLGCDAIRQF